MNQTFFGATIRCLGPIASEPEFLMMNDDGMICDMLAGGTFSSTLNAGRENVILDSSEHASANTRIQFIVVGTGGGDRLYVDNVQVGSNTNSAPAISSNGGAKASVIVAEKNATVTTVITTDADAGQSLIYAIAGGADAAKFTIDSNTGELRCASAPDYEAPTDTGGNNVYDVTVQVSDGHGGTDIKAIAVKVTNVNELPTDLSLSTNTVAEKAGRVTGTDPDRNNTKTYTLSDSARGRGGLPSTAAEVHHGRE